jgi:hypothetical protein
MAGETKRARLQIADDDESSEGGDANESENQVDRRTVNNDPRRFLESQSAGVSRSSHGDADVTIDMEVDTTEDDGAAVIPNTLKAAVELAVSVITTQLRSGIWWSEQHPDDLMLAVSEENNDEATDNNSVRNNNTRSSPILFPRERVATFSEALRHFESDVIVPSLRAQGVDANTQGRRAFLATCIMLREVLIVNAEGLFYPKIPSSSSNHPSSSSNENSSSSVSREERMFQDSIVVTALVLTALQPLSESESELSQRAKETPQFLTKDEEETGVMGSSAQGDGTAALALQTPRRKYATVSSSTLSDDFATLLSQYHNRMGLFAPGPSEPATSSVDGLNLTTDFDSPADASKRGSSTSTRHQSTNILPRLDCRFKGILPNGEVMSPEESKAWRISYNLEREHHFLISSKSTDRVHTARNRAEQQARQMIPPKPNAVAMYVAKNLKRPEGALTSEHYALRRSVEERILQACAPSGSGP